MPLVKFFLIILAPLGGTFSKVPGLLSRRMWVRYIQKMK